MTLYYPDLIRQAVSHHGSFPGETIMDCEKCDPGTRFSPNISVLPNRFSFSQLSIFIHPSFSEWTKDPLEATVA
jgi:hypothetical protein